MPIKTVSSLAINLFELLSLWVYTIPWICCFIYCTESQFHLEIKCSTSSVIIALFSQSIQLLLIGALSDAASNCLVVNLTKKFCSQQHSAQKDGFVLSPLTHCSNMQMTDVLSLQTMLVFSTIFRLHRTICLYITLSTKSKDIQNTSSKRSWPLSNSFSIILK